MTRQFRFGDWSFDADADVVSNGQLSTQLEPQVAKLLEYLLQHQDRLLSRERLLHDVWNGRIVSDDAIHRCIGILRQTLTPEDKQAFIKTVSKKGYIANFPAILNVEPEGVVPRTAEFPRSRLNGRPAWAWTAGAALLALLVVPLVLNVGGLRDRLWSGSPSTAPPRGIPARALSIAVLPFVDMSAGRDQEYFADGISEEILNQLSKTTTLRIIARTSSFSFKGNNTDIAEIAEALGVTHVLEGSVRKAGNRVRVTARLVDASDSRRSL